MTDEAKQSMDGIHYGLRIVVCEDAQDGINRGYVYRRPEYAPIRIAQVVVVRNGTEEGNPSVDLLLEDENGQKYAALLSGRLLKAIPCDP